MAGIARDAAKSWDILTVTAKVEMAGAATHVNTTWVSYHKLVYGTARKEEVPVREFTPLETKLKEIIDSYNDGRAIMHEDVIFYSDQIRKELHKEMQLEPKEEEK